MSGSDEPERLSVLQKMVKELAEESEDENLLDLAYRLLANG